MSLRIEKVVPTVNVGSAAARARMRAWTDRWVGERRRGGFVVPVEEEGEGEKKEGGDERKLWDGKDGKGGAVVW
jgi:DNA cross-link repair 1A protein